jgi:hypothetical protein
MKLALLACLAGSAAAFAPAESSRASTALNGALDDLKAVAAKSNPVLKVSLEKSLAHYFDL